MNELNIHLTNLWSLFELRGCFDFVGQPIIKPPREMTSL